MQGTELRQHRLRDATPRLPGPTGDGTRDRILSSALKLFASQGLAGASIRQIATEAGVESASLYFHFKSKESILVELIDQGIGAYDAALRAAQAEAPNAPRAQLAALIRTFVRLHIDYSMLAVLINHEIHLLSPDVAEPLLAKVDGMSGLIAQAVQRGIAEGDFHVPHLRATLFALQTVGVGVASWYPSPVVDVDVDELGEVYVELALRLVGAVAPGDPGGRRQGRARRGRNSRG